MSEQGMFINNTCTFPCHIGKHDAQGAIDGRSARERCPEAGGRHSA